MVTYRAFRLEDSVRLSSLLVALALASISLCCLGRCTQSNSEAQEISIIRLSSIGKSCYLYPSCLSKTPRFVSYRSDLIHAYSTCSCSTPDPCGFCSVFNLLLPALVLVSQSSLNFYFSLVALLRTCSLDAQSPPGIRRGPAISCCFSITFQSWRRCMY